MKILVMLLALVSCGKNEPLDQLKNGSHLLGEKFGEFAEQVGQAPRIIGNKLLGENEEKENEVDEELDGIKKQIAEIERKIDYHDLVLNSLYLKIDNFDIDQDYLSNIISENQSRLVELESAVNVLSVIDPCGDKPNHFDEVILVLEDGTLVGYFEDRGKRFLTVLVNGDYRTTDRQRCRFSVNNGEVVD